MFFDRHNEPDLGDEQFGACYDRDDSSPGHSVSYDSFYVKTILIPISWFTMTDEELCKKFLADATAEKERLAEADRLRRIAELEKELAKLKGK